VQVNQRFKAVFLAAVKEPIDGALLVDFDVVFIKILEEIIADNFPGVGGAA